MLYKTSNFATLSREGCWKHGLSAALYVHYSETLFSLFTHLKIHNMLIEMQGPLSLNTVCEILLYQTTKKAKKTKTLHDLLAIDSTLNLYAV